MILQTKAEFSLNSKFYEVEKNTGAQKEVQSLT